MGMIGLGRMGANLVRRLMRDGHEMVVWDRDPGPTGSSGRGGDRLGDARRPGRQVEAPRAIWIMVPAAMTGRS